VATLPYTGERMVPELASQETVWEHLYRYKFAMARVVGKAVLDIACGEGYGTRALVEAGAGSVVGVDISEEVCAHARFKYGLDTRVGRAETIPLPSGSLDAVVSFETIEHIERPESFLSEAARVLRPRGLLIISTPNQAVYGSAYANPFHCSEMNREQFLGVISRRFTTARLYGQCSRHPPTLSPRLLSSLGARYAVAKPLSWLRRAFSFPYQLRAIEKARASTPEVIIGRESALSRFLNPYVVRPEISSEYCSPKYYVALCHKDC